MFTLTKQLEDANVHRATVSVRWAHTHSSAHYYPSLCFPDTPQLVPQPHPRLIYNLHSILSLTFGQLQSKNGKWKVPEKAIDTF